MSIQGEGSLLDLIRAKSAEAKARIDQEFMRGAQFAPKQIIEQMKMQKLAEDNLDPLSAFQFNMIGAKVKAPDVNPLKEPAKSWIFADNGQGGFTFGQHVWRNEVNVHGKEHLRGDAIAHRNEALRRKVVCRFEDRPKEMAHWHSAMRFLEKLFALPEIEKDDDACSS